MNAKFQANTTGFDYSNMAIMTVQHRFSIFGQISIFELFFLELNQTWTQFVRTLPQDIYPFKPLTKICLMNLSNTNQSKLDYLSI